MKSFFSRVFTTSLLLIALCTLPGCIYQHKKLKPLTAETAQVEESHDHITVRAKVLNQKETKNFFHGTDISLCTPSIKVLQISIENNQINDISFNISQSEIGTLVTPENLYAMLACSPIKRALVASLITGLYVGISFYSPTLFFLTGTPLGWGLLGYSIITSRDCFTGIYDWKIAPLATVVLANALVPPVITYAMSSLNNYTLKRNIYKNSFLLTDNTIKGGTTANGLFYVIHSTLPNTLKISINSPQHPLQSFSLPLTLSYEEPILTK